MRDRDLVIRDSSEEIDASLRGVTVLYSWQNFEDFLILHRNEDIVHKWIKVCEAAGHFQQPLNAKKHLELLHKHVNPDYEKGKLPFKQLTPELLNTMLANNKAGLQIHSEFATWIGERWSELSENCGSSTPLPTEVQELDQKNIGQS